MGGPSDKINATDALLAGLSQPPAPDEMPESMLCPSSHRTSRFIFSVTIKGAQRLLPVWICPECVVVYRYSECTLVPGEEGVA